MSQVSGASRCPSQPFRRHGEADGLLLRRESFSGTCNALRSFVKNIQIDVSAE